MKIITTEILPPEASMSGKNSCYLNCRTQGRRPSYGVCLFTLRAIENDTIKGFEDCVSAYNNGSCDALEFRKQEQEAGRALFYAPREYKEPVARPMATVKPPKSSPFSRTHSTIVSSPVEKPAQEKPAPKSESESIIKAPSFADAVELAAKESASASASKRSESTKRTVKQSTSSSDTSKPKPVITAGMSLLDIARAMKKAKGEAA